MTYTAKIALLGGIIDYAGTFPPAALSLSDALKTAAAFRRHGRHPWLMGKLALPLADLKKIDAKMLYDRGADGAAWPFTALGSKVEEPGAAAFLRAVEWDLREIRRYNQRHIDGALRLWVTAYETRVPSDAFVETQGAAGILAFVGPVLDRLRDLPRCQLDPFFEVGLEANGSAKLRTAAQAISTWCDLNPDAMLTPGVKIRTGGAYVPTAELLGEAIETCATHGLRFKATQGLHHAVTHQGSFGFVNLFAALAFVYSLGVEGFGAKEVRRCLEETDASRFHFSNETFAWDKYTLTVEAIEASRRRHAGTFGSCSLDEPDESLAQGVKGMSQ